MRWADISFGIDETWTWRSISVGRHFPTIAVRTYLPWRRSVVATSTDHRSKYILNTGTLQLLYTEEKILMCLMLRENSLVRRATGV